MRHPNRSENFDRLLSEKDTKVSQKDWHPDKDSYQESGTGRTNIVTGKGFRQMRYKCKC